MGGGCGSTGTKIARAFSYVWFESLDSIGFFGSPLILARSHCNAVVDPGKITDSQFSLCT